MSLRIFVIIQSGESGARPIICSHIPLEAYDYVVNRKPALVWVMERQCISTDKDSGIVNDANLWATETMGWQKWGQGGKNGDRLEWHLQITDRQIRGDGTSDTR